MKAVSECRTAFENAELDAIVALTNYVKADTSWDYLETAIGHARMAFVNLKAAEQAELEVRNLGVDSVHAIARACGVHLGPDLRPESVCTTSKVHP